MRQFLLFMSLFFGGLVHGQVQLVTVIKGNISNNLNTKAPFHFTNNRIFSSVSDGDGLLRWIDPNTGRRHIISDTLRGGNGIATDNAIYYLRVVGWSSNRRVLLLKVDNNLNATLLLNMPSINEQNFQSHNAFINKINDRIYFHARTTDENRIYELNPLNDELTIKSTYASELSVRLTGELDDMIFYTVGVSGNQSLYVLDGDEPQLIVSGSIDPQFSNGMGSRILWGSTEDYVFIRVAHSNSNFNEYYRLNRITKQSELYFGNNFSFSSYYQHNGKEFFNRYLLTFEGDSVVLTPSLEVKNEFSEFQFTSPNIIFPDRNLFSYSNRIHGNEFYVPDDDDSLTLLMDFNPGFSHSYPYLICNDWSSDNKPHHFTYDGRNYLVLTNGNDPFMYLYEITNQGLISRFKIKDFKHTIRFMPNQEYLYYFVYDQKAIEIRLYRLQWNQMNDVQPIENLFNSKKWSTHVMYARKDLPCEHIDINARVLDVLIDNDSDVIASFQNGAWSNSMWNAEIIDFRNKFKMDSKVPHVIAKYSKYGELLWMNALGAVSKAWQNRDKILVDDSGDVLVFGTFWMKGHFDADSLLTPGSARFFAKIDKATGEVVEKKVIFQTSYADDTEFFEAVMGEDNHVYLAGKYMFFSQDFGDTVLHSMNNYQNFLAKYDNSGNLIWARNINNNWSDIVGEIRSLKFNEMTGEIHVYCSQNYNNWCNDLPFEGEVLTFDANGNEIRRKIIDGRFKHLGGELAEINDKTLLIVGSVQGYISGGVYEQFTAKQDNCFQHASYLFQYDLSQNRFTGGYYATNNAISFSKSLSDEEYIYLVGNNHENGNLTIVRFDRTGNYHGEKEINQKGSYRITYKDGYFALLLVNPNEDDFLHFHANQIPSYRRFSNYNESFVLCHFKIDDWTYSSNYHPMNVKFVKEDLGIFAFPNPAYDKIQFNFQDDELKFETYQICDASGRVISTGDIPNQNFLILSIDDLEPGLYHAIFSGGKTQSAIKFMKQN